MSTVTGHLCHSLSQSKGIGTAPNHAPSMTPTDPPKTSSMGQERPAISNHFSGSAPWTYINGKTASIAKCAAFKIVSGRCVVRGAPRSIWRPKKIGIATWVRTRERIVGCVARSISTMQGAVEGFLTYHDLFHQSNIVCVLPLCISTLEGSDSRFPLSSLLAAATSRRQTQYTPSHLYSCQRQKPDGHRSYWIFDQKGEVLGVKPE